jgi:AcrR family transcriptional regulator
VRRGGWTALSMQGLAVAAGVSRQLVYEHFATADDLHLATLTHLFERAYTPTVTIAASGVDVEETIGQSFTLFLDLPFEERHALRALAIETEPGRPSIARARAQLRSRVAAAWGLSDTDRRRHAHARPRDRSVHPVRRSHAVRVARERAPGENRIMSPAFERMAAWLA